MKNIYLSLAVLFLVGLASATPQVYEVVLTPLYANEYNTLTCRYITNDTSATAHYRFYDGEDGVWYDWGTTATYTSIANGYSYNCSVNLSDASGSTGWYNSSNNVTVSSACINPFPLRYTTSTDAVNITGLLSTYSTSEYAYVVYGDVGVQDDDYVLGNYSMLFLGAHMDEDGGDDTKDTPDALRGNFMYGLTGSGDFAVTGEATDENDATYYEREVPISTTQYSYYDIEGGIGLGTTLHIKLGALGPSGQTVYIYVQGNKTAGGAWETITSLSREPHTWSTSDVTVNTTSEYDTLRVKTVMGVAGGFAPYVRVYEIERIQYNLGETPASNLTSLSSFTVDGGFYVFDYLDEETEGVYNFSSAGTINSTFLRAYCDSGYSEINITDDYNQTYSIGVKQLPRRLETFITYDDTSTYYRRLAFCDAYSSFNYYLINADTHTPRLYTFTLNDIGGSYTGGSIHLKRQFASGTQDVTSDLWDAANQAVFYLVDNREYSITLDSDGCGLETNLGWVTSNPADTAKTITAGGAYDTTPIGALYKDLYFNVDWDNASSRINMTFYDAENESVWFWWGVYYANNLSLAYSDNTTTHNYHGSYLANASDSYLVKIMMDHPDGSVDTWYEGTIRWYNRYLDELDYPGEKAGLTSPTFWLIVALTIMCVTALMATPLSAGFASLLVLLEAMTFSVLDWLPLFHTDEGKLIFFTCGLLAIVIYYIGGFRR